MRVVTDDLLRAVAAHCVAYPYKVWGYGEGIALEALVTAGDRLGEPGYLVFVAKLMARWLAARADVPYTDHVAPGRALLMVYERTGDPRLLARACALGDFFAGLPTTRQGARLHRPDHAEFHSYVYVDCMDFDAPFLCALARAAGESGYFDLAADCLLSHARALWDAERGLFYHLYDAARDQTNGAFWGRGNGWAALGMVGALEQLPAAHQAYADIAALFLRLMASLVELQTADGEWHTVLDEPSSYCEASLPAMFYYALRRGLALGLLPRGYRVAAERAWGALLARLGADGVLGGVSQASPPGAAGHYAAIPTGGVYPWGQGPALEALLIGEPA